ncbi:aspartic peptidase domain-containing protein [Immersiella caudata]|uniref:Aspartic peptidase domain-containing protein n=1 Tax=Immersiella caudata TaxID=314043 RepID=A0AA39WQ84_9PEZI|nr:aspartic peptidase domain-containing protein [Immersiella caudata]
MSPRLRILAAALPAAAAALDLFSDTRIVQEPGLIRFPVTATEGGTIVGPLAKRQIEVGSLAALSGTLYTVNINIGTPGQTVPVQFDTGSSELWVNPVCSKSTTPSFCDAQGRFTLSSSIVNYGVGGSVTYGTGYAEFDYVSDFVRLGSATITQQIFGVATDSAHAVVGIMGAGPALTGWSSAGYPLVIDSLYDQSLINSRAFSMDLRGFDSPDGAVIFGGIDTKKYQGSLVKLPVVPDDQSPDGLTRWYIRLAGIKVSQPGGSVVDVYTKPEGQAGQAFLVDSGYTLSALPTPIFNNLVAAFPSASYVPSSDLYTVDCMDPGEGGTIDFIFGDELNSKTIKVPYYDFVWHAPGTSVCVLGAFEDSFPVLGDTFLRSAYVVYDWDNRNIHLAQSENCGSNLVAIGQGANAVPNLTGECSPSTPPVSSVPPVASSSAPVSSIPVSASSSSILPSSAQSSAPPSSSSTPPPSSSVPPSSISIPPSVSASASVSSSAPASVSSEEPWCDPEEEDPSSVPSSSEASSTPASVPSSSEPAPSSVPASSTPSSSVPMSSAPSSAAPSSIPSSAAPSSSVSVSIAPSSSVPASSPAVSSGPVSSITSSSSVAPSSKPVDTITYTRTDIYTITSCPPHVYNCHPGHVTTEIVAVTTTVCPQTTATYAIPQTYVCPGVAHGCKPGETITTKVPLTLKPHVPGGKPVAIPQGPHGGNGPAHGPVPTGVFRPGHGVPGRPAAPGGGHGNGGGYVPHPTGGAPAPQPPSPTQVGGAGVGAPAPTTLATQAPATYGGAKPTGVYTAGAAQVVAPWLAGLAMFGVML